MADTVGVSRSTVSRESIEASEAALQQLLERSGTDIAGEILVERDLARKSRIGHGASRQVNFR